MLCVRCLSKGITYFNLSSIHQTLIIWYVGRSFIGLILYIRGIGQIKHLLNEPEIPSAMAWKRSWQSGLELQVLTAMLSFIFGVGVRIILSSDFHGVVPSTWNQLKQTLSELHAHLQKTEWFVSLHQICVWTWETTGWCFQQLHKKGVFPIVWVLTIWWFSFKGRR